MHGFHELLHSEPGAKVERLSTRTGNRFDEPLDLNGMVGASDGAYGSFLKTG